MDQKSLSDIMSNVVIALGGSLIDVNSGERFLQLFSDAISRASKDYKLFIVVGGGQTARKYIRLGRKLKIEEERLDELGISATRLNALLITSTIEKANRVIPISTSEAAKLNSDVVIMGGTSPGHSTDMVAAELAHKTNARRLIIATDVDGIYDKDPKKYNDTKMFYEIYVDELIERYGTDWKKAGENVVIDGPALDIIRNLKSDVFVLNGKNIGNLINAVYGRNFIGTKIKRKERIV